MLIARAADGGSHGGVRVQWSAAELVGCAGQFAARADDRDFVEIPRRRRRSAGQARGPLLTGPVLCHGRAWLPKPALSQKPHHSLVAEHPLQVDHWMSIAAGIPEYHGLDCAAGWRTVRASFGSVLSHQPNLRD